MTTAAAGPTRQITAPGGLSRQVAHGALWSGASNILLRLANIAVTAVVVRIVSPHDFGVFAVALAVHAVVSSIGELGATSCISRRDLDADQVAPTVATTALLSSVVLALVMALLAGPLAAGLGAPDAASAIRILSLGVLLIGVFAVPSALLARDYRQKALFVASAVGFVPANTVLLVLARHGQGAEAFAWSRIVGHLVTGLVVVSVVRYWRRPGFDRQAARLVLGFGLPLAAANLLNYTLLNADYAFISRLLGATELGIYTLAFNVASWSTAVLGSMINGVAMPAFSQVKTNPAELRRAVAGAVQLVALVACPICALTAALAPALVGTLFGPSWSASAAVLAVLSLYGGLFTATLLLANVLVALGRSRLLLSVQVLWIGALIPSVYAGVELLGVVGAAVAHVVVIALLITPVYVVALRRATSVSAGVLLTAVRRPALAGVVAGLVAYAVDAALPSGDLLRLAVGGAVGTTIYAGLVAQLLTRRYPHLAAQLRARVLVARRGRHVRARVVDGA